MFRFNCNLCVIKDMFWHARSDPLGPRKPQTIIPVWMLMLPAASCGCMVGTGETIETYL